jgi:hypothetical protein
MTPQEKMYKCGCCKKELSRHRFNKLRKYVWSKVCRKCEEEALLEEEAEGLRYLDSNRKDLLLGLSAILQQTGVYDNPTAMAQNDIFRTIKHHAGVLAAY